MNYTSKNNGNRFTNDKAIKKTLKEEGFCDEYIDTFIRSVNAYSNEKVFEDMTEKELIEYFREWAIPTTTFDK